jgi:hypothetical protein
MTYAELKEQELRPTVPRGQDQQLQENQHLGQQRGGHARYWYQTRHGGKVSVCGSQLERLEHDKIIDAFTIIAKHSGRQREEGDDQEAGDFSPYTIPLRAHQQVRSCVQGWYHVLDRCWEGGQSLSPRHLCLLSKCPGRNECYY